MRQKMVLGLCLCLGVVGAVNAQEAGEGGNGRGGRGMGMGMGGGMMGMMSGRGLMGTVIDAAADHLILKTYLNETYVVHVSVNTRFVKAPAGGGRGEGMRRREGGQSSGGMGMGGGMGMTEIKASDIKKGDDVAVMGEIDPAKKEAGATAVAVMDPERAQAMKQMVADYGKSWLMGKVTAIDGVKLTVTGALDNQPHVIVADENTTLRKRREPVTLADIQVGDSIRADGAVKGAGFAATSIQVMGMPQPGEGRAPGGQPSPQQ